MREPAGIDDGTSRVAVLLQEVDERTLVIRLERDEVAPRLAGDLPATRLDLLQGRPAVDLGIAGAEKVQIRTVHEESFMRRAPRLVRRREARARRRR